MRSYIDPRHKRYACILGVALGSVALGFALSGCSGGDTPAPAANSPSSSANSNAGPGMASGGGGPAPMGISGMSGGGFGGGGGQAVPTAPPPKITTAPPHRVDPFQPWFNTQAPPPPVLSQLQPVRVAIVNSAAEEKPEGVEIQEVPNRRVAGILTGNGVYALLDNFGGDAKVVRPGDVLDDGYRVASINSNSVTLKKVVDNRTYTQVVPLTDAGSSTSRFSAPAPPGNMGTPGMLPGMAPGGGVPGAGRRGKGGGGGLGGIE